MLKVLRNLYSQGQRAAQYAGYLAARGDYLTGVDADDWVGPARFSSLLSLAGAARVIVSGMTRVADGDRVPKPHALPQGRVAAVDFIPVLYGEPTDKLLPRSLVLEGFERYRLFFGIACWRNIANMPLFWAMYHTGEIYYTPRVD